MKRFYLYIVTVMFICTGTGIAQTIHVQSPNGKIDMTLKN